MANRKPTKAAAHKIGEYDLVPKFLGYRARDDRTTLPIGTLIAPSQNFVTNTSGRMAFVKGYTLDGSASATIDSGILSNFDFTNFKGNVRNLRAGFLTAAANDGKLQYRYRTGLGTTASPYVINWVNLKTSLTNVRLSYTEYWDNTKLFKLCLWVDGTNNVFSWNGAVTTLSAATYGNSVAFAGNNVSLTTFALGGTAPTGTYVNGSTGSGVLGSTYFATNPTNGQTLTLTINSTVVTINFVSVIGAVAGNVLIGANTNATVTNLLSLLTSPGTTSATQVALSGPNQTLVGYLTSTVAGTITKEGTTSWNQEGFYTSNNTSITINGTTAYNYTGGSSTTVLWGITPDPTLGSYAAGTIIHQTPVTVALSTMTSILATFAPTLIGCGQKNQVYLGSSTSSNIYISKVNDYTNYAFTSPVRVAGEGFQLQIDAPPTKFIAQEDRNNIIGTDMYISQGLNNWSVVEMLPSADLTKETITNRRMKVAPLLGAKSERLVTKMKNEIVFAANDNTINFFGYQSYQYVPAVVDFSFPIVDDQNSYDLTDGSLFYHKNYLYEAVPKSGIIRIYNMTDQSKQYTSYFRDIEDVTAQPWYWEAPVTYPISGFYVVDGELYGHSYTTSESYKLFTGGSLNGQQIDYNATFSYDDRGDRTQSKGSNELWVEGYIKQNTTLTCTISGDLDSFMTSQTVSINGNDNSIVAYGSGAHALGTTPLGSAPIGGAATVTSSLPAWFHVTKTYPQVPSYLESVSFTAKGIDLQCELITFGTNAIMTAEGNNAITQ